MKRAWASFLTTEPAAMSRRSVCLIWIYITAFVLLQSATLTAAAKFCAADYYVQDLPDLQPDVTETFKMHAGHMPVDDAGNWQLFFWLVQARNNLPKDKLVIWLNGGPGCSSMDGMFLENGPFRVTPEGKVVVNPYSWSHNANILYVDQPAGTGLAYTNGTYATSQAQIYITGESYAGMYIPYIASEILMRNRASTQKPPLHLRGITIGNGWMDPLRQYPAYIQYAQHHGLLSGEYLEIAIRNWNSCSPSLQKDEVAKNDECEKIVNQILRQSETGNQYCINMYDIRLRDTGPNQYCGMAWPDGLSAVTQYLHRSDVVAALHATAAHKAWQECDSSVMNALAADRSAPSYKLLPDLLSQIEVTLFSGDQDLICNWFGTRDMISELEWNGGKGFEDTPKMDWYVDDQLAGFYQTAGNLSFVVFYDASHMVPIDKPKEALAMFNGAIRANSTIKSVLTKPGFSETVRQHYYAGGVLLVLMLLGTMAYGAYRLRDRLPFVKSAMQKVGMDTRRSAAGQSSSWREVEGGDEEALFNAEDIEEEHDMRPINR
ncbi:uncharacterized protein SPPG_01765 [Spizellomyces punctatus DAOM BR117]|uniref:Carboxypeptidase n=1 Tax=Spizellomyces punctatus (strain DAOM BR117) TaxID=645134 RepID=A0A0L0HP04_SPIPD|nr:uncharacterized protein SPPG_01765 [Spizellomyces punctatus DAOM BR117]KND02680.1 hypothetical protein SPPG_01765 [Spizellomyces punctatus DAOM BR117]|eukprot:XP_016610719.1 hypothetical protein SPPG_01765 [Spizellomyces punctatus DAOM BR117]